MNALETVLSGRRYDLGHPLDAKMPSHPGQLPYLLTLARRHGDLVRGDGYSSANEVIVMSGHHSTHIDALGHGSYNGLLHGGLSIAEVVHNDHKLARLSVSEVEPIVTRGLLFDIPRFLGRDLTVGEAISARDLERAAKSQKMKVVPGDAILIRTGWSTYPFDTNSSSTAWPGAPGPDLDAARWIVASGAQITGSDTIGYECVVPGSDAAPVHAYLLVDVGMSIIECLNLESLAADRLYEFLFICSPLKLVGATGSPVRPIAIAL
jgi:kynurenine formamidase